MVVILIPVFAALLVIAIFWTCFARRNAKKKRADGYFDEDNNSSINSFLIRLRIIQAASKNFSNKYKLGGGDFGPIYKGKLHDGREISVRRLSSYSVQGVEELKTKVMVVAKLLHKNLVMLLGFCLEENEKLLVYEYLPNGSLDKIVFGMGTLEKRNSDGANGLKNGG
nr:cysteine-rich receptor-like protein kinase 10 [Ziziphus jujuba var. spinosa]